ncbi:hypothetical protein GCM10010126_65890 [Planomonospora parontospora]|uniref:Uncharacterized protein n=1 Tax=Planomonospora parontospora TaxID=58119 RepID=A0AA37F7Z4_9ACTN|nr:hypothetical protein GCM10010126_65890 [Planomonospora parontospora]
MQERAQFLQLRGVPLVLAQQPARRSDVTHDDTDSLHGSLTARAGRGPSPWDPVPAGGGRAEPRGTHSRETPVEAACGGLGGGPGKDGER